LPDTRTTNLATFAYKNVTGPKTQIRDVLLGQRSRHSLIRVYFTPTDASVRHAQFLLSVIDRRIESLPKLDLELLTNR
jgi:hypothetical protein